jgi:Holliday junction resolvase RusA-like endonuclease
MTTEYDYNYKIAGPPRPQLRHRVRHIPGKARYIKYKAKMLRIGTEVQGFYFVKDGCHYIYTGNGSMAEGSIEVNGETIRMVGRYGNSQMYDDPKSKKDKDAISMILRRQAPPVLLDCPLRVDLVFNMPRPQAHYGTGKNSLILKSWAPKRHTKKPDIDNLRKLVMDALTGVIWRDDSIVCEGTTTKQYGDVPGTEIYIKVLKEPEPEKELF